LGRDGKAGMEARFAEQAVNLKLIFVGRAPAGDSV